MNSYQYRKFKDAECLLLMFLTLLAPAELQPHTLYKLRGSIRLKDKTLCA